MRKVLIRVNMNIPKEDLAELEKKLKNDFENGLVIIPWYCSGYVIGDDMTEGGLELCGPTNLDEPVILQQKEPLNLIAANLSEDLAQELREQFSTQSITEQLTEQIKQSLTSPEQIKKQIVDSTGINIGGTTS
jgi:hypothetical protein